ncbi:hypothetical protein LTR97_008923 [Elasticomyces elasticus]|uniref:DUF202 domain-containing protein n=1 Tax=Elasticomyces elasticus TaxID=574655 RepID=A0AAN7ZMB4_9PEZI|nr:hypothetical protein LTR97_008923 [Elasticomyces elasticus]
MAPLPCSPVSNSTASEQSHPTSGDSDDSLTTPRPGPSDPSQRTQDNLSRPSIPAYSSSPESSKRIPVSASAARKDNSISPWDRLQDGQPRNPYTYGSIPKTTAAERGATAAAAESKTPSSSSPDDRQRSVSFTPQTLDPRPERKGSYSGGGGHYMMGGNGRRPTPNVSPHSGSRSRMPDDGGGESSADESTAIFPRDRVAVAVRQGQYGAMAGETSEEPGLQATAGGYDGEAEELDAEGPRKRKSPGNGKSRGGRNASTSTSSRPRDQAQQGADDESGDGEHDSWFKQLVEKYGSVELENKGSVARDHLALERTFLAWLRTSLSFASIGIAVTQLFRLNTSLNSQLERRAVSLEEESSLLQQPFTSYAESAAATHRLRHVGKPLGATFLGISILILLIGFHRYFESQHYVIRGKFPASRGSIILVSLVAFCLIVASLIVVVAVAPSAFEKR